MFEVPGSDIITVRIDDQVILGKKPIEFIRADPSSTPESTTKPAAEENAENNNIDNNEHKSKAKTYA